MTVPHLSETNEMVGLGMIYRQFRLLIQAREIDEGGSGRQVEKSCGFCPSWRIN